VAVVRNTSSSTPITPTVSNTLPVVALPISEGSSATTKLATTTAARQESLPLADSKLGLMRIKKCRFREMLLTMTNRRTATSGSGSAKLKDRLRIGSSKTH
jgi:hypothetical protein